MTPDDRKDLDIHFDIERLVQVFAGHRKLSRARVFDELCNGDGKFEHGLTAICELRNITREELNERISAFIEAEKEEQAERAIRTALAAEADA